MLWRTPTGKDADKTSVEKSLSNSILLHAILRANNYLMFCVLDIQKCSVEKQASGEYLLMVLS